MAGYLGRRPEFGDFSMALLTGDGGAAYTLPFSLPSDNLALVFLNGAPQIPGTNFSISDDQLVFTDNVAIGVQIYVHSLGSAKALIAPSGGSVGVAQLMASIYATATESQALSSLTKLLSPGGLNSALKGSNQSLAANGYQKLPGGLIIQWGVRTTTVDTAGITQSFPIAFPSACLSVSIATRLLSVSDPAGLYVSDPGNTGFVIKRFGTWTSNSGNNDGFYYVAIGY